MNNYIKMYDAELIVKGPVFIGSGNVYSKKEYIFDKFKEKVMIPDIQKMYHGLSKMNYGPMFEKYMLDNDNRNLGNWLYNNNIKYSIYKEWIKYELSCGDYIADKSKPLQISEFIKDPYGMVYVPGSSIKGMLRTILLSYSITNDSQKYRSDKFDIENEIKRNGYKNKKCYLKNECSAVETKAFNTLNRPGTNNRDMVNDYMSGLIISDSEPISIDKLVLCQKIEQRVNGKCRNCNVLRESIKPGTKIKFKITVDTQECKLSKEYIELAIKAFSEYNYKYFISKFENTIRTKSNNVWLGGGSGFVSKTVLYQLFGDKAVELIPRIYSDIGVPNEHKHRQDVDLGVSPHILKVTRYNNDLYQFGLCEMYIKEEK